MKIVEIREKTIPISSPIPTRTSILQDDVKPGRKVTDVTGTASRSWATASTRTVVTAKES